MKKSPQAPVRSRYHHGDLPSAVVEAALRRVAERGVESFSLREVARDIGVDASAVYRHFKDKSDVLAAVARAGFARMASQMDRSLAHVVDPLARLRAVGRAYVLFAAQNPDQFRVMFGRHGAGNDARVSVRGVGESGRNPYEILTTTLAELAAVAPGLPLKRAALAAWCGVHGLASLVVEGAWRPSRDQSLDDAVDTLIEAFVMERRKG